MCFPKIGSGWCCRPACRTYNLHATPTKLVRSTPHPHHGAVRLQQLSPLMCSCHMYRSSISCLCAGAANEKEREGEVGHGQKTMTRSREETKKEETNVQSYKELDIEASKWVCSINWHTRTLGKTDPFGIGGNE